MQQVSYICYEGGNLGNSEISIPVPYYKDSTPTDQFHTRVCSNLSAFATPDTFLGEMRGLGSVE
jgi:hypothetical protein